IERASGRPERPPQAEGLPHRGVFITIRGPQAHPDRPGGLPHKQNAQRAQPEFFLADWGPGPSEKWPDCVIPKSISLFWNCKGRSVIISMVLPLASTASGPRVSRTAISPAVAPTAAPMAPPMA